MKKFLKNLYVLITLIALLVQSVMLVFFYALPDPLGLSLLEMFSGKIQWQMIMAYGGILVISGLFMLLKMPRGLAVYYIVYFFFATADYEVFRFSHQRLSYSFVRTYFHPSNLFDSTSATVLGGDALGSVLWIGLYILVLAAGITFVVLYTLKKRKIGKSIDDAITLPKKAPISFISTGVFLSVFPLILFLTGTRAVFHVPIVKWPIDMQFNLGKYTLTSPILHIVAWETFEFVRDNEKVTKELVDDLNTFLPADKIDARQDVMNYPVYFNAAQHEYKAQRPYNIVFVFGESYKGRILNQMLSGDTTLAPNLWKLANVGGLWFKNAYSGGYPTVRGTTSTYLGFPTHPNRDVPSFYASNHFKGFPEYLENYKRAYVTISNPVFDHTLPFVERFFGDNWKLIPEEKITGTADSLGADLAIQMLGEMPYDKPWFLLFNTIATHIPFYSYPDAFAPKPDDPMIRYRNALRYTDQQFGRFMESLSQRSDFDRTVVVFLGDHDTPVDSVDRRIPQPIGVSSSRIFMGIFSADTNLFQGLTVREDVASQLDIGPTIFDLAQVRASGHFWGYDLLTQERPANQPSLFFGENGYYLGFRDHVLTGGLKSEEVYSGVNQNFVLVTDSASQYWRDRAVGVSKMLRSLLRNDNMMP